jgi:hypothetical protein
MASLGWRGLSAFVAKTRFVHILSGGKRYFIITNTIMINNFENLYLQLIFDNKIMIILRSYSFLIIKIFTLYF